MKKYTIWFLLFCAVLVVSVSAGYLMRGNKPVKQEGIPNATIESETVIEDNMVINQDNIEPRMEVKPLEQYYLVSEDGFLLVFCQDKSTICLYTHMPLAEFPEEEQGKLREGIWFPTMLDIYNYLESYSS